MCAWKAMSVRHCRYIAALKKDALDSTFIFNETEF